MRRAILILIAWFFLCLLSLAVLRLPGYGFGIGIPLLLVLAGFIGSKLWN